MNSLLYPKPSFPLLLLPHLPLLLAKNQILPTKPPLRRPPKSLARNLPLLRKSTFGPSGKTRSQPPLLQLPLLLPPRLPRHPQNRRPPLNRLPLQLRPRVKRRSRNPRQLDRPLRHQLRRTTLQNNNNNNNLLPLLPPLPNRPLLPLPLLRPLPHQLRKNLLPSRDGRTLLLNGKKLEVPLSSLEKTPRAGLHLRK